MNSKRHHVSLNDTFICFNDTQIISCRMSVQLQFAYEKINHAQ